MAAIDHGRELGPRVKPIVVKLGQAVRRKVELLSAVTMEAITGAVVAADLATREEIAQIVDELYRLAGDGTAVMSTVRVVQAWGRKPG